jgi:hypothetical protein
MFRAALTLHVHEDEDTGATQVREDLKNTGNKWNVVVSTPVIRGLCNGFRKLMGSSARPGRCVHR